MAATRRRVGVGLGLAGAVCALLGVCLLLVGPVIIKEQVVKVSGVGGFGVVVRVRCMGTGEAGGGAGLGDAWAGRGGCGQDAVLVVQGGGCWGRCVGRAGAWVFCLSGVMRGGSGRAGDPGVAASASLGAASRSHRGQTRAWAFPSTHGCSELKAEGALPGQQRLSAELQWAAGTVPG